MSTVAAAAIATLGVADHRSSVHRAAGPGIGDVSPPEQHVEAWSVLPPGNGYPSGVTARNRDDQRPLYEALDDAVAQGPIGDGDLDRYYKSSRTTCRHTSRRSSSGTRPHERRGVSSGSEHVGRRRLHPERVDGRPAPEHRSGSKMT